MLLATAIIGVATALYAFASGSDKASEKEKELQRQAEATKKKMEEQKHAAETLGGKIGDLVGSFKVLQSQWKSLKTEADKKEWIKNNQTAFDHLNLSVWNVNDAYDVFVKNAPKVIAALKAIAEAEAYQELYKDAIKKKASEWDNRSGSVDTGDYYRVEKGEGHEMGITQSEAIKKNQEWVNAGLTSNDLVFEKAAGQVTSYYKLAQSGIDKINKYRREQAQKTNKELESGYTNTINHYGDLMDAANTKAEEAKATLSTFGGTGTRPSTHTRTTPPHPDKKKDDVAAVGSLSDLEKQLSDLQKKYKDGLIKLTPEDYKAKVKDLEEQIRKKKIELGIEVEVPEGSIRLIEDQIAKKNAELQLAIDDESRQRIQKEIDALVNQKNTIELKLKPVIEDKDVNQMMDDLAQHTEEV